MPDEVLVAECARRNLRVHGDVVSSAINTPHLMKGQGADAIEKLLAVRYTTLGELGIGSSSVVYEISPVKDPTKRYALKVMQKGSDAGGHSGGWENTDDEMHEEVSILRSVHHPCIAGCIEVFESVRAFHLVLERLNGGELRELLLTSPHKQGLSEFHSRSMARQLLEALAYLQLIGIAHRDVKLDNLLLVENRPDSVCKLCDFGLAKNVSQAKGYDGRDPASVKSCRAIVDEGYYGTLDTMAPEVMTEEGDEGYGPQCDVYSAGCVISTLLSGYFPFDADSTDEFERLVRGRPVEYPCPVEHPEWEGVSDSAKDFLQQIMTHDPLDRPTAAEALQLPWLNQTGGSKKRPAGKTKTQTTKKKGGPKRTPVFQGLSCPSFSAAGSNSDSE